MTAATATTSRIFWPFMGYVLVFYILLELAKRCGILKEGKSNKTK